jgi:N-acetylneuraminic acid mutarotase
MRKKNNWHRKRFFLVGLLIFILQFSIYNLFAQSPNSWVQKAAFPGAARMGAVGFTIGSKGYVGTGIDSSSNLLSDFWEYDPSSDAWTQVASFGGSARRNAVGFAIGSKGYVGTGYDGTNNLLDFWEYDPSLNSWIQTRSLGGSVSTNPRRDAASFVINNMGYVVTGYDGTINYNKECWQFDGDTTWLKKTDMGSGSQTGNWRRWATGLSIDSSGYIACGFNFSQDWRKDFWRYNATTNTWTQMADFGGTQRSNAIGFSIDGIGFIGTGNDTYLRSDFWQYKPSDNVWIQVTGYPGGAITGGVGFSINGKGYSGLGRDSLVYRNDFWEYTPDSTIGIDELTLLNFNATVFPNPCLDKLHVICNSSKVQISKLEIYASNGDKINIPFSISRKNGVMEFNTTSLFPGVYFLVMNSENKKVIVKFIKQ